MDSFYARGRDRVSTIQAVPAMLIFIWFFHIHSNTQPCDCRFPFRFLKMGSDVSLIPL
jgi:hypothetical protein